MSDHIKQPVQIDTAFLFSVFCDQMTSEQCNHVRDIAKEFTLTMAQKYANGQREHGGNLWDLSEDQLIDNAIMEAVNQVVYLTTIRLKRRGRCDIRTG